MFELCFVHRGGFALGSFHETFKKNFRCDLDQKIIGYENVHKLLVAMPKFVWIQKLCEAKHLLGGASNPKINNIYNKYYI